MYCYKTGIPQIDQLCGGLESGTNILILAPPMSYADQLAYALVRPLQGEYSITLSTNERAAEVVDFFKASGTDKRFVGVIDAITKSSTPSIADTQRLMFVSSPTDLTGIGIKFSNMVESIFEGEFSEGEPGLFPPPVRFCVNSISTLLMYRRLEVLYQFLHVLTAKVKKIDGVGVYVLNSESFDDKTLSLIKQLMNGVIEVKIEQNTSYLRILGMRGISADWLKFGITKGLVSIAMISTGMFGLDDMLGGGIPRGSRVLYSMESGVDGQLFMISTLSVAVAKGHSCLVILPNTTVDAFQHDVAKMRKGELDLSSKKICFIDTIDRERIQRSARSPEAAEQGWQARIAKICREKQVEIIFAYFDLLYEEFGLEKGLKMLISAGDDPKPTLIIEHLNLEGSPLLTRFIDEFSFDLVIAIRSSNLPLPHFNYFTLVHASWLPTPARSIPFIISDGRIVPYIPRIVVTGPAKSGKSTFVANASEDKDSVFRTKLCNDPATAAMDLGWLRWKDFDITLYGTPGEPRFDLVVPPVLKHTMGVVLVIDATSPDTMARAKRIIAMVAAHRVPFVIAANKKDLPDLMSESKIRKSLGVLEDIPLIFISATRKADVIFVLESLVDYITRFAY